MSSAAVEALNRIRESQRSVNHKSGERLLWNAAPVPVSFWHNADEYIIPPNGPGKMPGDKEVKSYDGVLRVYDRYGIDPAFQRDARIERKKNGPAALDQFPQKVLVSSLQIVEHAVKKLAARGVTLLTGDPATDETLKAAAREAWIEFRREECEKILSRYDIQKAKFYAEPRNANLPPPPMTPAETEAFVWLADYRLGLSGDVEKYTCPVPQCPFQHESEDVMQKHMRAYHPTYVQQHAEDVAEEDEPKRRGRKKDSE